MADNKLHVTIISQEKQLDSFDADWVNIQTADGEITVLPGHIPLLSKLQLGEVRYKNGQTEDSFVVSRGFLDVGPDNTIKILVDSAVAAREISLEKAQAAVKAAHEAMSQTVDRRELMLVEASLKKALLEIRVAQKTKRTGI